MIKALLFDLDGTLLSMDSDKFAEHYVQMLIKAMIEATGDVKMKQLVLQGIDDMMKNTTVTNKEAFFKCISAHSGISADEFEVLLAPFYKNTYPQLKDLYCSPPTSQAIQAVRIAKAKNIKTVLATNPLFPRGAVVARVEWAGLTEQDFDEITTFEDYCAAKPRKEYFLQILERMNLLPEECVFIGNDCSDDLSIGKLGVKTFWLTEFPINNKNITPQYTYSGKLDDLLKWIEEL